MLVGLEYIKYRWKGKRRHGIHSPFVYDFTDNCLSIPIAENDQSCLTNIFNQLRKNDTVIQIQDFGVGSKKLNNQRKISAIFKTSSSRGSYGKLLYQIAKHYQPKEILELGTSLGIGTLHFHLGNPNSNITTVEACPATYAEAKNLFNSIPENKIKLINATFSDYFKRLDDKMFDVVFIDGHHDGTALIEYINNVQPYTNENTIFILDDIRWSNSMYEAWLSLTNDKRFNVSLDLFRMGILLRRPQQEKEHFTITL